jgi:hypothetical protein
MASSSTLAGSNREWLPIEELTNVPTSHQNHPQITLVAEDYPTNARGYAYLRWEVTHPASPVVWRNDKWYTLRHSKHTGHPYHAGEQIDVYPTPTYAAANKDEDNELAEDLTNLQIRSTPAIIDPSGPGSPHRPRSIELRTSTRAERLADAPHSSIMSTQTMAATQTIAQTLAGGGGEDPPPNPRSQSQDPQRIRDTFDIALGRAPRPPGGPGGPNGPGDPGAPGEPAIPPDHLVPIQPGGEIKQAGMTPQPFDGDRTKAEAFLRELRLYMMANQGVPGFESPIRHVAIALTFIKGSKVDGWVEAMLQAIEQLLSWTQSTTSSITSSKSKVPQVNPVIRPARDPEKQGACANPSGDLGSHDQIRNKSADLSRVTTRDQS